MMWLLQCLDGESSSGEPPIGEYFFFSIYKTWDGRGI
jgi:hypothetical protein